jgi:hypothetical protein
LPRLEAGDVELGLRYLPQFRVLVIAEALEGEARRSAMEAAEYSSASVVMVAAAGSAADGAPGSRVTVLERGGVDDDEMDDRQDASTEDDRAFAALVADYALRLDRLEDPSAAFSAALGDGAWEASPG